MTDDAISRLHQMRTYHQEQLDRVNDALALLKDTSKVAAKAERLARKVQARVTGVTQEKPISGTAIARQHANFNADHSPSMEIKRLVKVAASMGRRISFGAMSAGYYLARKEKLTGRKGHAAYAKPARGGKTVGQIAYQRKKTGDSAINRIRALFLNGGVTGPLTREQIQEMANVAEVMASPRVVPAGTGRILATMTKDRELKETPDGWVALKVKPPRVPATNGSGATA